MRRCFVVLLSVLVSSFGYTQKELPQFGKASVDELKMQECSFDKNAPAEILINQETVEFLPIEFTPKIKTERRIRLKIFNKAGFKYANIKIPYLSKNRSKLTDISAVIYNLESDGSITVSKIGKDDIINNKANNGLNTVAFTFSGLREGSVVEYRFTRIEKEAYHIEPWFLQDDLPIQSSVCVVKAPVAVNLTSHAVTTLPFRQDASVERHAAYNEVTKSFEARDIPAFTPEPFMSSLKDHLQRIEFTFAPGIFSIATPAAMWRIYSSMLFNTPFLSHNRNAEIAGAAAIIDSVKKIPVLDDKIQAVYRAVKKQVAWNGWRSFYADNIADTWNNKSGNSAEINLTILNLLIKSGIECYPILISTRNNGKADLQFASLAQFNGVDVFIKTDSSYYVLDGTLKNQPYNIPAYNVVNRNALIIDSVIHTWIRIENTTALSKNIFRMTAALSKNGEIKGEAAVLFEDIAKVQVMDLTQEQKEKDAGYFGDDLLSLKIDPSWEENNSDDVQPLVKKMKFSAELSSAGNYYFLKPNLPISFKKNPFTDSVRHTDIDFGYSQRMENETLLTIPEGVVVETVPADVTIRMADSAIIFTRTITTANNAVKMNVSFEIKEAVYAKEDYNSLKNYFDKVYTALNESVLLKKTTL